MLRSLSSILTGRIKQAEAFTLQVVFVGKVKPEEFWLYEVLSDGLRMSPDPSEAPALYPFTAIKSIAVEYVEPPEAE